MHACFLDTRPADAIPIIPVMEQAFGDDSDGWLSRQEPLRARWLTTTGFKAKPGSYCLIPNADGTLNAVVTGAASSGDVWAGGALPGQLPAGSYYLERVAEFNRRSFCPRPFSSFVFFPLFRFRFRPISRLPTWSIPPNPA